MLQDLFGKLDDRQRRLLACGLVVLLVAAAFSYALMPRIKAYRTSNEARDLLVAVAVQGQALSQQLADLGIEVEELSRQLHGDAANLPDEQLEAFVIARLQTISWRNDVELLSVTPSAGETVQAFRESVFRVELAGGYFELHDWLAELSAELGFVVIKEYQMRPIENVAGDPELNVNLSIASYRLTNA